MNHDHGLCASAGREGLQAELGFGGFRGLGVYCGVRVIQANVQLTGGERIKGCPPIGSIVVPF